MLHGEHVDLYYYPEEEELSRLTLVYAEESYNALERRFSHTVTRRIPFIIYASHSDFEQTNVLPFVPPEGLLGVTDFLKRRVTLPFRGNYTEFRHTIRHEMVHVFQLSLYTELYVRYPRLRRAGLPLWWSEGLAEYFSAGEDSRDEMILRDMTVSGRLPTLRDLTYWEGGIVYPLGGVIHRFLAETYGEWRAVRMYTDLWKYPTYEDALRGMYGKSLDDLSEEWQYWMRQRYYPVVAEARPLAITARRLTRLAIKPVAFRMPDDSVSQMLYFSPSRGYTDIYAQRLDGGRPRAVVKGERSEQFESFHFFESRLDVSTDGVVAFSSKYFDRDALFLWDLRRDKVVGRYQFPDIVSILSPSWAPDRQSVVFSGLSMSGYSDLYRFWFADNRLERLTSDRYEDLDPSFSPDGRTIVFASDRTAFGPEGKLNLFRLDVATGAVEYLTYGPWRDENPRWSPTTGLIYFASDRDGTYQIYAVDTTGSGRRITNTLNGAFDPQWVDKEQGIVFGGFADLSFNLYFARPVADTGADGTIALAADRTAPSWGWPELADAKVAHADATPYEKKFTLDFAAGDAVVAPGIGSAQGAVFLFSDLLSDHVLFLGVSSFQGTGIGSLVDNFNGMVFYLNQAHRINWGLGAFRQRGVFYEADFTTLYDETAYGAFAQLRYPLNRFQRIEAEYRIEHSNRFDIASLDVTEPRRRAWLASNYLSLVKDNTLWLATGPIDGTRYNLTGGLVNDISHGRFDAYIAAADVRRYLRTSLRSAVALRGFVYYAGGERPRRVNIGGSWGVRGYPRWGYIAGTTAWMVNAEWRFPITDFLSIGFPFGEVRFPGVQGAFFTDLGRAWTSLTRDRGTVGSSGLGLRMSLGPPLVLRLDMGWRHHSGDLNAYGLPQDSQGRRFVDFFFGFNY